MDIVTGYQGKEHVKADQLRRLISGMAGDGTYVLETQNKLAATMVTANQVRIDTGDLIAAGGAYATVETPETLTIESGVTGQKRIDLVVARYEKAASTNVESMELAVVKGTPVSYGDPTDPELSEGSIMDGDSPVEVPLWRIPIDGLAPGTPVRLFETIPTIDSLRDSVSQNASDIDSLATSVSRKLDASRVLVGSKVISLSTMPGAGQWVAYDNLLTASELRSMLGRNFHGAADAVVVWNGDWGAANVLVVPFARTSTTTAGGNVGVYLTSVVNWSGSGRPGSMRVGYMIVRGS